MKTLYELLRVAGGRYNKYPGLYGIELETEAKLPYEVPRLHFWKAEVDNSLRDFGIEYILKAPLSDDAELEAALDEWVVKVADKFALEKDSMSTSTHVHVNMLNETPLTLANFFTIIMAVENLLIKFSGPTRMSNLFCMPMRDAERTVSDIISLIKSLGDNNYQAPWNYAENENKYGACNIASLSRLGTVELRCYRGVTTKQEIKVWIKLLDKIMQHARHVENPLVFYRTLREKGVDYLKEIFADQFVHLDFPNKQELLDENIWFVARMSVAIKDWSTFGKEKEKKRKRLKNEDAYDRIAQEFFQVPYADLNEELMMFVQQRFLENAVQAPAPAQAGDPVNIADDVMEVFEEPRLQPFGEQLNPFRAPPPEPQRVVRRNRARVGVNNPDDNF